MSNTSKYLGPDGLPLASFRIPSFVVTSADGNTTITGYKTASSLAYCERVVKTVVSNITYITFTYCDDVNPSDVFNINIQWKDPNYQ